MDAQAYLMRHGWTGPGNPLNKNQRPGPHGGLGLTKPILVARKANNHGVGKKTTKDATNQWWLRGFEDALKGVGQETPAAPTGSGNALTSELYRFFVRGEGLAGTLDKKNTKAPERTSSKSKRKRDTEDDGDERKAKKEEKAARKEEKKRRKLEGENTAAEPARSLSEGEKRSESKEERRARRKEKKEKKSRGSDDSSAGQDSKDLKKSKKSKCTASEEDYPTPMSTEQETDQGPVDTTKADAALEKAKAKKEKKESKKSKRKESETGGDSSSKKKSKKDKEKKSALAA